MAILQSLTMYTPILYNKTRWSGKHHILKRFIEICDALIEAQDNPESTFDLNATPYFINRVKKHEKILNRINITTKVMQSEYHTLLECREDLDMLIEDMDLNCNNSSHDLYKNKLGKLYIAEDSKKLEHIAFESGVCKIQNDDVNEMTTEEHNACKCLLISNTTENTEDSNVVSNSYEERRNSFKRRKKNKSHDYGNCNFILGSAAVVERLWSIADRIIDGNRARTSPSLMEAMLFLRENRKFWDIDVIQEAFHKTPSLRVTENLEEDNDFENQMEN